MFSFIFFVLCILFVSALVRIEDALAEQAAAEEQEMERQSAVESLQLKKFNHRRKFQRVLFENK